MTDLRALSAAEISGQVRAGKASPRSIRAGCLAEAQRLDTRLNAFISLGDPAREDDYPLPDPERGGSLCGVPVAVKDLMDQAGLVTTAGSAFYRRRAQHSAPAIARLEAAGAMMTGRTNLHEFAFGFSSENPWFGPVRNPWDPALSAGGSSGGSAAAVSAGIVPAALGTDTGGSVRTPAALCGIVGLKVSNGRIPLDGVFPLAPSLDTVGPLTRTVGDARLLYRAMADPDSDVPRPPGPTSPPPPGPAVGTLEGVRVAVPMAWLETVPASRRTRERFEKFCDDLARLGAEVRRVAAPELVPDRNIFTIVGAEASRIHREWLTARGMPYGGDVAERLRAALAVTAEGHRAARARREWLRARAGGLFAGHHLLATPAVGRPRKTIGLDYMDIDGTPVFYRAVLSGFTALVNHLGCPALVLPLAAPGTPPPSAQLIAPWREEELLLDVGTVLEKAGLAGYRPPPPAFPRPPGSQRHFGELS